MPKDKTEITDAQQEEEGIEESEQSSEANQEASTDTTEAEKEEETPKTEPETGEEEKSEAEEKSEKEESFDQKVNRLVQSRSDKLMKPLRAELDQLRKDKETLTAQVNEKSYDRAIESIYGEEVEKEGEETAAKRKTDRQNWKKAVLEYQQGKGYVEKTKPELEQKETILNFVERDQKAREEIYKLLFPEDKAKIDQITTLVKRFEKAQDPEDFEIILETIKNELKAKSTKKTFTPDSGHQGGGGADLKGLSPLEKIQRGLKKESKTTGG